MAYVVIVPRAEQKALARLAPALRRRTASAIDALAQDPRPHGAEKLTDRGHLYRIRVGDYRAVYSVDDAAQQVRITRIAHRRDVYR